MKACDDKLEAVTAGINPMLNYVGFASHEGATRLPGDLAPWTIVDQCQTVWMNFKEVTCSAAHWAVVHALIVLRSHYPLVKPEVLMTSFARGTDAQKTAKLEDKAEEAAVSLAGDVDLFNEGRDNVW